MYTNRRMHRTLSIILCLALFAGFLSSALPAKAVTDINTVAITGYVAPVAGQKPVYDL